MATHIWVHVPSSEVFGGDFSRFFAGTTEVVTYGIVIY
jgi:hypothetical protein